MVPGNDWALGLLLALTGNLNLLPATSLAVILSTALWRRISHGRWPELADCAIFYSITNCQEGLRGISFGNLLIKQVVHELAREFPRLRTFATLSPVPGFRTWLADLMRKRPAGTGDLAVLQETGWHQQAGVAARVQPLLMSLCAWYLTMAKKDAEPLDAVARFHLGNGARMERLNWLADTSRSGMQRAAGMMVNYVYRLSEVEQNHEAFVHEHEIGTR